MAIGVRQELVGVSKWCKDVARVGKRPTVGDCWTLDIEQVSKLRPTLLIGSVPFKPETVARLLQEPVALVATNPRSLSDIDSDIRLLGRLVERSRAAEKLIHEMRRAFEHVRKLGRHTKGRPRVYCEAWPKPRITSPPWVGELVQLAGGEMALPAGQRITEDEVSRARPDIIVLAWTATGDRARSGGVYETASWWDLPAVRNRHVVVVRDELLNTPGPPLMEGAVALLRAIHPESAR
jgi:iron complex transport system substrate-binding protein